MKLDKLSWRHAVAGAATVSRGMRQTCVLLLGMAAGVAASATTVTFSGTGSNNWTVPAGVSSISIVATGGGGGGSNHATGGAGGKVTATLTVSAGQVLSLYVGGGGGGSVTGGGGGGGSTNINAGGANQIIAGGGGGAGFDAGMGGGIGTGGSGDGSRAGIGDFRTGGDGGSGGVGGYILGGSGNGGPGGLSQGSAGSGSGSGSGGAGQGDVAHPFRSGGGGGGYGGGGAGLMGVNFGASGGGGGGSVGPAGAVVSVGTNYGAAGGGNGGDGSVVITYSDAVVVPAALIDLLAVPNACAFGVRPAALNMASGVGPAFGTDMTALLKTALQQPLVYVEQTVCGAIVLNGYNGGKLAFIPYGFQTGDSRANGVYPLGLGQYQVVRDGQSLTIAPTLVHLEQLIGLLGGANVSQVGTGVLIASLNGVTYAVQPSVAVQPDAATGSARLAMGGDGYWHFIDALGNNQILYPAFADAAILRDTLKSQNPGATLTVQLDGTASVVINGQRFTWAPDLTLSKVPAERVGQYWWQESATRYWVANAQPLGTAQGFTVKP